MANEMVWFDDLDPVSIADWLKEQFTDDPSAPRFCQVAVVHSEGATITVRDSNHGKNAFIEGNPEAVAQAASVLQREIDRRRHMAIRDFWLRSGDD